MKKKPKIISKTRKGNIHKIYIDIYIKKRKKKHTNVMFAHKHRDSLMLLLLFVGVFKSH